MLAMFIYKFPFDRASTSVSYVSFSYDEQLYLP